MPWLITLGILFLFGVLLFLKIKFHIELCDGQIICNIIILFFHHSIYPSHAKKKDVHEDKLHKGIDKQRNYKVLFEHFNELFLLFFKSLGSLYRKIVKKIIISNLIIKASISSGEAYQTAVCFGGVSAGAYNLLAVFNEILTIQKQSVQISPNFESGTSYVYVLCDMYLRVWNLIALVLKLLVLVFKNKELFIKLRKGGVFK